MVGVKGSLKIDHDKALKKVQTILGQVFRQAARAWLRYIIVNVPVQTGMAKGALAPLGRFLRVAVPISPTRKPYKHKLEGGVLATPQAGADKSEFDFAYDGLTAEFTWSTDVLHYWLSKYYSGKAIPGDQLLQLSDIVFEMYVTDNLPKRLAPVYASLIAVTMDVNT